MKPVFEPSAQEFLDSQRAEGDFQTIFNHLLDEANRLADEPEIDGETKFAFDVPFRPRTAYRIYWGRPVIGRRFWYLYEADAEHDELRIFNIGHAGLEKPFLSRR